MSVLADDLLLYIMTFIVSSANAQVDGNTFRSISCVCKIWKTMANEKVMYRSKSFEINKWFADGPFTSATGVPQESAPQLGVWLGWNIVRQYMERHPEVTLNGLLSESDLQKILSSYVPGKS